MHTQIRIIKLNTKQDMNAQVESVLEEMGNDFILKEIVPLGNSDKDAFITLALHFERLSYQSVNPVYKDANNNTPATEKQKKYLSKLIDATQCEDVPPLDEISKKDAGIWIGKLSKQAK